MFALSKEDIVAAQQAEDLKKHIEWLKQNPDALHKEAQYYLTELGLLPKNRF